MLSGVPQGTVLGPIPFLIEMTASHSYSSLHENGRYHAEEILRYLDAQQRARLP